MSINMIKTEQKIVRTILYNFIIFLFFFFWFFYSTYDNVIGVILICFSIIILLLYSSIYNSKINNKFSVKFFHLILILISIFFIIEVLFFYKAFSPTIFILYNNLIGIEHQHDILLFIFYLLLTILKVLPIRFFYNKLINLIKEPQLDNYIGYFIEDFNKKKLILLILLVPMAAFVEEFIFRSLLLTVIVNYLNWNIFIAILFISSVFGILHYSSSRNWAHFLSTLLSSIIYFFALIQLGLLYPWILHLTTNSLALLFFYQNHRKNTKKYEKLS